MHTVSPVIADESTAVERLLADPLRQPEARARLAKLLDQAPSTLAYVKWSRRLSGFASTRRIAVLSSYTVETITPFLEVEAYLSRWKVTPYFLQYSRWQPALLDPADALQGCDAAVLLLDETAITTQLGAGGADAAKALAGLLSGFRARSTLSLFVGLIPARPCSHEIEIGQDDYLERIARLQLMNAAIAAFCLKDKASHLLDVPGALAACGQAWHDSGVFSATMSYVNSKGLPALARAMARSVGALLVPRHKVLVTDLDDTLWGGILGEDGVDGIVVGTGRHGRPYAKYQDFLKRLRAGGVVLAIVSKNDEADVRQAFEARKKDLALAWDDFTIAKVNWNDKYSNLQAIADELGLGLDSFVFVDDSPVECEGIRHALPMVTVVAVPAEAANLPEQILATRAFDTLTISHEDRNRADQYHAERARRQATTETGDIAAFLASLDLRIAVSSYKTENADRVLQLLLKTNQFHLTLERPSPAVLSDRRANGTELYAVKLVDRFGDYGIIGVVELEAMAPSMLIRNLAISCRALGRKVEEAILAFAAERARIKGCDHLKAIYVAGPRNRLVPEAMQRLGFTSCAETADGCAYHLAVTTSAPIWPAPVTRIGEGEVVA